MLREWGAGVQNVLVEWRADVGPIGGESNLCETGIEMRPKRLGSACGIVPTRLRDHPDGPGQRSQDKLAETACPRRHGISAF